MGLATLISSVQATWGCGRGQVLGYVLGRSGEWWWLNGSLVAVPVRNIWGYSEHELIVGMARYMLSIQLHMLKEHSVYTHEEM